MTPLATSFGSQVTQVPSRHTVDFRAHIGTGILQGRTRHRYSENVMRWNDSIFYNA